MDDLVHLKLKLKDMDATISKEVTFDDCESWTTLMLTSCLHVTVTVLQISCCS